MLSARKLVLALMTLLIIAGCRSSGVSIYHISQDIDFSFYKKVAVLPLDNLTTDRFAADILRQVVISELLASGLLDVVVPGEVSSVSRDLGIKSITSLDNSQITAVGNALKVEAIIMGSVVEYGIVKMGNASAPQVSINLMMADTNTGSIIWSITKTRGGAGFMAQHFGAKHETLSETALTLVRESISTLAE
jgi:hypothetical protein